MELVSVIVPVYNVENYLHRCINSIRVQNYENMEIILVDDGSKDSSGKICDEYAEMDSRIIVLHKENGGLSEARNVALDICKGKWISFIDSDDYVAENHIKSLYEACIQNDADMGVCGRYDIYQDRKQELFNISSNFVWNKKNAIENLLLGKGLHVGAWGKLYKRDVFADVRYPVGEVSEDVAVIMRILNQTEKIVHTGISTYYYLHRSKSLSSSFNEKQLSAFHNYQKMYKTILNEYPYLKRQALAYYDRAVMSFLNMYYFSKLKKENSSVHEIYEEIDHACRSIFFESIINPYLSFYEKVILSLYVFRLYEPCKRIALLMGKTTPIQEVETL